MASSSRCASGLPPAEMEAEVGWHLHLDHWGQGYATARRIGMRHLGQTDDYYKQRLEFFRLRPEEA